MSAFMIFQQCFKIPRLAQKHQPILIVSEIFPNVYIGRCVLIFKMKGEFKFPNIYIGRWVTGLPPSPRCSTTDAALCLHLVVKQFLLHYSYLQLRSKPLFPVSIWWLNNSNSIATIYNWGENLSSRSSSERINGSGPDLPGKHEDNYSILLLVIAEEKGRMF